MDLAVGKVNARADMALATRLRQIVGANHRPWIGGRQYFVDAVATGAIGDYL
jgi:hypothetical protein